MMRGTKKLIAAHILWALGIIGVVTVLVVAEPSVLIIVAIFGGVLLGTAQTHVHVIRESSRILLTCDCADGCVDCEESDCDWREEIQTGPPRPRPNPLPRLTENYLPTTPPSDTLPPKQQMPPPPPATRIELRPWVGPGEPIKKPKRPSMIDCFNCFGGACDKCANLSEYSGR